MPSAPLTSSRTRPMVVSLLAIVAAGCGAAGSSPRATDPQPTPVASAPTASATTSPSAPTTTRVTIAGFAFSPSHVRIPVGTTVTWTNEEDALHTVVSGGPDEDPGALFDSGELDTGDSSSYTFESAGRVPFFCDRHPFMRGEVVVGG